MTTDLAILILACAAWINRVQDRKLHFLLVQNRVLRETGANPHRITDEHRRTLGEAAHGLKPSELESCEPMVPVDTLRRYYRNLTKAKWTFPNHSGPGRPSLAAETIELVLRIARENPGLGTPGIARRLRAIGIAVGRTSVQRILDAHGVEPTPARQTEHDWETFLKSHADQIAAIDATAVEVLVGNQLETQWCVMAISHDTRRVHLVGITNWLTEDWMVQQARNLTDADAGILRSRRYRIMDRGPNFSAKFRRTIKAAGIESVRTPPCSPNCNPFIERFFRSLKDECLNHVIPFGQSGLRHLITEYLEHYHRERPHAGLGDQVIDPDPLLANRSGTVACRRRLGGLLTFYHWVAA